MRHILALAIAPLALTLACALVACEDDGPLEDAAEEIDEGIDEIGDEID